MMVMVMMVMIMTMMWLMLLLIMIYDDDAQTSSWGHPNRQTAGDDGDDTMVLMMM